MVDEAISCCEGTEGLTIADDFADPERVHFDDVCECYLISSGQFAVFALNNGKVAIALILDDEPTHGRVMNLDTLSLFKLAHHDFLAFHCESRPFVSGFVLL